MTQPNFPPQAHPFRMIDVVLELERDRCTTVKAATHDEAVRDAASVAAGLYPFPLLLEAMAQAAAPLSGAGHPLSEATPDAGEAPAGRIVAIDEARLLRPVAPGDRILITATVVRSFGHLLRVRSVAELASAPAGEGAVAEAVFTFSLREEA